MLLLLQFGTLRVLCCCLCRKENDSFIEPLLPLQCMSKCVRGRCTHVLSHTLSPSYVIILFQQVKLLRFKKKKKKKIPIHLSLIHPSFTDINCCRASCHLCLCEARDLLKKGVLSKLKLNSWLKGRPCHPASLHRAPSSSVYACLSPPLSLICRVTALVL